MQPPPNAATLKPPAPSTKPVTAYSVFEAARANANRYTDISAYDDFHPVLPHAGYASPAPPDPEISHAPKDDKLLRGYDEAPLAGGPTSPKLPVVETQKLVGCSDPLISYGDVPQKDPLSSYGDKSESTKSVESLSSYSNSSKLDHSESGGCGPGRKPEYASLESSKETVAGGGAKDSLLNSYGGTKTEGSILENSTPGVLSASKRNKFINTNTRDWNSEFQTALEAPEGLEKSLALKAIAYDFVQTAQTYGKIIIAEAHLPEPEKTIKSVAIGGIAGGEKFVAQGILFKFALDQPISPDRSAWMYGGPTANDERAMKGASHELKGVMAVYQVARKLPLSLCLPLLALVDYRGYRLLATSILPIGKDTFVLGSNDAGVTFQSSNDAMMAEVDKLGKALNLQQHLVSRHLVPIYGPGDLEGHIGFDNRMYLVDCARLMPPEAPDPSKKRSIYYNLLRPEFVARAGQDPLCSDAFAGWGSLDPKFGQYNDAVRAATKALREQVVATFAATLDEQLKLLAGAEESDWVVREAHRMGINLRHLALVRSKAETPAARRLILTEMTARVCKNVFKEQMRNLPRRNMSPDGYITATTAFLNTLMGQRTQSKGFWTKDIKDHLVNKYGDIALTEEERKPEFRLSANVDMNKLMVRIETLLGITLTRPTMGDFEFTTQSHESLTSIMSCHLQTGEPLRVKHANIVDWYDGVAMDELGTRVLREHGIHSFSQISLRDRLSLSEAKELLRIAGASYSRALCSAPGNFDLLVKGLRVQVKLAALMEYDCGDNPTKGSVDDLERTDPKFASVAKAAHIRCSRMRAEVQRLTDYTLNYMSLDRATKARLLWVKGECALHRIGFKDDNSTSLYSARDTLRGLVAAFELDRNAIAEYANDFSWHAECILQEDDVLTLAYPWGCTTYVKIPLAFIYLEFALMLSPRNPEILRMMLRCCSKLLASVDYMRFEQLAGYVVDEKLTSENDEEIINHYVCRVAGRLGEVAQEILDRFLDYPAPFYAATTRVTRIMMQNPLVRQRAAQLYSKYDTVSLHNLCAHNTTVVEAIAVAEVICGPHIKSLQIPRCPDWDDISLVRQLVQHFPNVEKLSTEHARGKAAGMVEMLTRLPTLTDIHLDNIEGDFSKVAAAIAQMPALRTLHLEDISLGEHWEAMLTGPVAATLTVLNLEGINDISVTALRTIHAKVPGLTSLRIRSCSFKNEAVIDELRDYKSLTKLHLESLSCRRTALRSAVAPLTNLTELNFQNITMAKAADDSFAALSALTKLQILNLRNTSFLYDADIVALKSCRDLRMVESEQNNDITLPAMAMFLRDHPALEKVKIGMKHSQPEVVVAMVTLANLSWLHLEASAFDDNCFKLVCSTCTNMQRLHLMTSGITSITCISQLQQLDCLSLRTRDALSDADGPTIATLTKLRVLLVPGATFTEGILPYFALLPNLAELDIQGTQLRGADTLDELLRCPKLCVLALSNTPIIETARWLNQTLVRTKVHRFVSELRKRAKVYIVPAVTWSVWPEWESRVIAAL